MKIKIEFNVDDKDLLGDSLTKKPFTSLVNDFLAKRLEVVGSSNPNSGEVYGGGGLPIGSWEVS